MANSPRRSDIGAPSISRRDFVNGLLAAAAAAAMGRGGAASAQAQDTAGTVCGDILSHDPRLLRSGNLPAAFNVAHWLRDNRLSFEPGKAKLSAGCDAYHGTYGIADESSVFDVIIIGAGLAGLSAAYYVLRERPMARILLLEANDFAGGNAARDASAPLPVPASTAGAFCSLPNDMLAPLYREIGIDWERYVIQAPMQSYFFDKTTPGVKPGYRGWRNGHALFAEANLKDAPYPEPIMRDLLRCEQAWKTWAHDSAGPDDPPDNSSPRYDDLSTITLADYLTKTLNCDPHVADFYTNYTVDCMGGTAQYVSAHPAISFLATEHGSQCFTYPGGTSEIAARLVHHITSRDRKSGGPADVRLGAVALRIEMGAGARPDVGVTYFRNEGFHRATGKAVIVATQAVSARRLIAPLADAEQNAAWSEFNTVPAVIANVAVRSLAPLAGVDLAYANYYWGSRYWSNFEISDWTTPARHDANRATVLTFYGGITSPPDQFTAERLKLLQTPFSDYETSLREDVARLMGGTSFDFDRDVSAVFVYRWGHSMILPTTKSIFGDVRGRDGRLDRSKAPRRIARKPLGPISFAGQHTEGSPSVESAIGSGHRAAHEVLARL